MLLGKGEKYEAPKTVGDAKIAFQKAYGRPANAIVQSFVNELISAMTIAIVSPSYRYSRVMAFGFENLCTIFLAGLPDDEQRRKVSDALCISLGLDPAQVKSDANAFAELAAAGGEAELFASEDFTAIASTPNFKYSYPFGAGLLAAMPLVGAEMGDESIDKWCEQLNLRSAVLKKDYALYESSTAKLNEVRQMMMEMQAAAKRKEATRLREQAAKAAAEADEAESASAGETEAEAEAVSAEKSEE